jgi:hypothetical protein
MQMRDVAAVDVSVSCGCVRPSRRQRQASESLEVEQRPGGAPPFGGKRDETQPVC